MRLAASLLVLYSHGYALAGLPEPVIAGFSSLGSLGVYIFFAISGYLLATSWLSDPNVVRFALRRALRIFPALAMAIVLSVFILGPVVTTLPLPVYFRQFATYQYLANIALYVQYYLPGCFEHSPIPNAVNGSLWSLAPEVLMYVVLCVLGCAALLTRRLFVLAFSGAIGLADLYLRLQSPITVPLLHFVIPPHPDPVLFWGMNLHHVMYVAPFFWAGTLLFLYRDRVKLRLNTAILAFMIMALLPPGTVKNIFAWFAIPYIVLAFATQNDRRFAIPSWFGDLSYGIYIYAFPIQQTVYFFWHTQLSFWQMMAVNAGLTLICAFLSWHIVETPALRLKPKKRKGSAEAIRAASGA